MNAFACIMDEGDGNEVDWDFDMILLGFGHLSSAHLMGTRFDFLRCQNHTSWVDIW